MKLSAALGLIATVFMTSTSLQGQDALFSEVAMESVFNDSKRVATETPVAVRTKEIGRITGVSGIQELVEQAGFAVKTDKSTATFTVKHAEWQFPVVMRVDVENDLVLLEMRLGRISDKTKVDQATLLELLAGGDSARQLSFAFDPAEKVLSLRHALSNRSVTVDRLLSETEMLARYAGERAKLWSQLHVNAFKETSESLANSQDLSLERVVGRWLATPSSGEAFALEVTAKERFKLVHVTGKDTSSSAGRASVEDDSLLLTGDNGTIVRGQIRHTKGGFEFTIRSADGTQKAMLDFKRS